MQPETESSWPDETKDARRGSGDLGMLPEEDGAWEAEPGIVEREELRVESLPRKGEALSEQVPENVGEQMALELPPEDGGQDQSPE